MPSKSSKNKQLGPKSIKIILYMAILGDISIFLSTFLLPMLVHELRFEYVVIPFFTIILNGLLFASIKSNSMAKIYAIGLFLNLGNFLLHTNVAYLDITEEGISFALSFIPFMAGFIISLVSHYIVIKNRHLILTTDAGEENKKLIEFKNQIIGYIKVHKKLDLKEAETQFNIDRKQLENLLYSLIGSGRITGEFTQDAFIFTSDVDNFVDELSNLFTDWDESDDKKKKI